MTVLLFLNHLAFVVVLIQSSVKHFIIPDGGKPITCMINRSENKLHKLAPLFHLLPQSEYSCQ